MQVCRDLLGVRADPSQPAVDVPGWTTGSGSGPGCPPLRLGPVGSERQHGQAGPRPGRQRGPQAAQATLGYSPVPLRICCCGLWGDYLWWRAVWRAGGGCGGSGWPGPLTPTPSHRPRRDTAQTPVTARLILHTTCLVCVTVSQQACSTCVICLSRLQPGNTVRRLACLHLFHTNCVDAWLLNNRSESLCKCYAATRVVGGGQLR